MIPALAEELAAPDSYWGKESQFFHSLWRWGPRGPPCAPDQVLTHTQAALVVLSGYF